MIRFLPGRKLSFAEVGLIPEAMVNLFIARLFVSFRPSRKWMPKTSTDSSIQLSSDKKDKAHLVAGVINGLAKRTPWTSTCLVKALATHRMLDKRKIENILHIGVTRKESREFEAHAWLSVQNDILLGGGNLESFHEISRFS